LTSQVFGNALRPLRADATVPEVRGYLRVTAATVLAAHWRRTLGHPVTDIDVDTLDVVATTGEPEPSAAIEQAMRILERLTERHRNVLTLRFLRGYSLRDTALELGITVGHAK